MHVVDIHDEISAGDGRGKRAAKRKTKCQNTTQKLSRLLELYTLLLPCPVAEIRNHKNSNPDSYRNPAKLNRLLSSGRRCNQH